MTYQIKEIDGKFQLWQTGENTHQLLGAYDTREEAKEKINVVEDTNEATKLIVKLTSYNSNIKKIKANY